MAQDDATDNDGGSARFETLLSEATADIRAEVERLARTGEANLERLARQLTETLIREVARGVIAQGAGDTAGSVNQIAAAVARAAQRGTRFT